MQLGRPFTLTVMQADILIAAIGKPNFVQADWVKPGAAIIDVGINSVDDESAPRGYRLVGDVDFDAVRVCTRPTLTFA